MKSLYDKLVSYSESDYYGFHMPGDKRNMRMMDADLPYNIDITEIEGFDDLHHATGILKQAQIRAAKLYKAEKTCFLVNGSTGGILSAILGCTKKGDRILVARNCHKSVYHAIFLNELIPVYVYPTFYPEMELNGEIAVEKVEKMLAQYPDVKAVVITSPTYDGVISDVEGIAAAAHAAGVPLIVDEAHGAHLGFHPYFTDNANTKGADLVIHSLHKTLPALTQTALLHMNGSRIDKKRIRSYLDMLQTSSPSYVLMSSIDVCIELLEKRGDEVFAEYTKLLDAVRAELAQMKCLKLLETTHYDRSKIVISVKDTDYTSGRLYRELLDTYHLQMEMVAGSYILAITTIGDTEDGMRRFVTALKEIDQKIYDDEVLHNDEVLRNDKALYNDRLGNDQAGKCSTVGTQQTTEQPRAAEKPSHYAIPKTEVVHSSAVMAKMVNEAVVNARKGTDVKTFPWNQCVGHISTEYAYLYPPGSPLLVPGERISQEVVDMLECYREQKFRIEGLETENSVEVWINE
ncbi:aminotransferase class I/II-fold pyridoxal phosphate-dependent enzyme [Hespellia stercorisuis]|uniref:Arginine/lysine/ornithine decarboxylase n=1 Tax=Hespellia stercorisuis DSM 15480 TaxID=1121950 RepID=A0A1M6JE46_9FIRM|nr:aminotransferase class V-fold PLP-dependent enzyme [Hespellia stercorisuis]SHJ44935.1 Arginine/lysine/ornithine decarboxylase [Hespellia stercorisuis DSM 15480]